MSRPDLLTNELIIHHKALLPLWEIETKCLVRHFITSNFPSAIGLINAVAIVAEAMDHHPELRLFGWNKVSISISTHDKGGLTELDFELARKIDALSW